MKRGPLISCDFDGVLHSYTSGWQGAHRIPDPPVPGMIEWLIDTYEWSQAAGNGVRMAIFSARNRHPLGRRAMRRWLHDRVRDLRGESAGPNWDPIRLELVEWLEFPWFKPPAIVFIDDRAWPFDGLPPDVESIIRFQPWFRRKDDTST